MIYIVERQYGHPSNDERLHDLTRGHRAYWQASAARGELMSGGPWQDCHGDALIISADEKASLQRLLMGDPYARRGLVIRTVIREWNITVGRRSGPRRLAFADEGGLTPHERRIATMMVDGMTNREIAGRFCVSSRAVEQHITQIYRKLCIKRRAQLAVALRQNAALSARLYLHLPSPFTAKELLMPFIELLVPSGSLTPASKTELREAMTAAVLDAMRLPQDEFFRSATWTAISEYAEEDFGPGNLGDDRCFLVSLTALAGFLDTERNEALGADVTQIIHKAVQSSHTPAGNVWMVLREIPEGNWSVNGHLTRRSVIDAMVEEAAGRRGQAGQAR